MMTNQTTSLTSFFFSFFAFQHANNVRKTAVAYKEKLEQQGNHVNLSTIKRGQVCDCTIVGLLRAVMALPQIDWESNSLSICSKTWLIALNAPMA